VIWGWRGGLAREASLGAEQVAALRTGIAEMREPPLGLEDVPHPALEAFFDEILCAPTTEDLVWGVYQRALHYLTTDIEVYQRETNPLTDAPSRRVLKFTLLELNEMKEFGRKACEVFRAP